VSSRWIDPQPVDVPPALRDLVRGHPLVAELLARKGILTVEKAEAFLDPRHYKPTSPHELPGMEAAVRRLARALQERESVVVWGDFDVDGQTATSILLCALRALGIQADFYIPNRLDQSHGLNQEGLDDLIARGTDLLLTCDCGVSDIEQLIYCQAQGLDVIVTDHHDVPDGPAPAVAVVAPGYLAPDHPLYELCGAGVAYKLAEALLTHFRQGRQAEKFLDLVALGTLADIVPLVDENRYLVQRGLPLLADASKQRVGIKALVRVAGINLSPTETDAIGFALSPILNSSGRMESADMAVHLLTTDDAQQAEEWAAHVIGLNEERRYQTSLAENLANDMVSKMDRPLPPALVLASAEWHQGVTGIVAGRLANDYHRPTVLISLGGNGMARGSARSVAGIDIHHAIVQQADLLLAEGGHPMAAGFAVKADDLEEFRGRLIATVGRLAEDMSLERTVSISAWIDWGELSLGLCDDIYRLSPFGEGNRPPILASERLEVSAVYPMGDLDQHFRLRVADESGLAHDVVWWNGNREAIPRGPADMAYILKPNFYAGVRKLQLELVDLRRTRATPIEAAAEGEAVEVLDLRQSPDLHAELDKWLDAAIAGDSVICWGEGRTAGPIEGLLRRDEIGPAETLVIWTIPSEPDALRDALVRTGARNVVLLFGDNPTPDVKASLTDLVGLVKFTVGNRSGQASVEAMAGALAARRGAVLAGLELLRDVGTTIYDVAGPDGLFFSRSRPQPVKLSDILALPAAATLRQILEETAAYRRYLAGATVEQVLPPGYYPGT